MKYSWTYLGEEGIRISKVLGGVNPKNEMKCLQKWVNHLDQALTFPIKAEVTESQDSRHIRKGDKVLIMALPNIVDLYGIIATINLKGSKYEFPLCDLEAVDKKSANFQLINDYLTWFSNR